MNDISVIILSYNEELHIQRCIQNARKLTDRIFVVDCFSADSTVGIAKVNGAQVYPHEWPGLHWKQFNWALQNLPIKTNWVLRLDADEYLSDSLIEEINCKLEEIPDNVSGIVVKLGRYFYGRKIKHGTSGIEIVRIFRYGHGKCEPKFMDEHIVLSHGKHIKFKNELIDHNLKDIGTWSQKHISYSIREAIDLLNYEYDFFSGGKADKIGIYNNQTTKKRIAKTFYIHMPLFFRCFLYFIYRYIIRLGFLDGKEGFLWHFLQGWWYRTLVDARIWQVRKACGKDRGKIKEYIRSEFGYNIQ
jgi:glycosyltransferase involved in cell wall biosynthesis